MNQNTEYKDWDKTLCYLVDNGCFDDARKIAYTYIKQYQADETFVILFILFQISDAENLLENTIYSLHLPVVQQKLL